MKPISTKKTKLIVENKRTMLKLKMFNKHVNTSKQNFFLSYLFILFNKKNTNFNKLNLLSKHFEFIDFNSKLHTSNEKFRRFRFKNKLKKRNTQV